MPAEANIADEWAAEMEAAGRGLGELGVIYRRIFNAEARGKLQEAERVLDLAVKRERRGALLARRLGL